MITGRRAKYLVVLVVLLGASGLASLADKVVLTSDPAVLLPDGAESVRALRAIERFVPASGALWKATRASADKGASAWREIVANLEAAIGEELPVAPSPTSSVQTSGHRATHASHSPA